MATRARARRWPTVSPRVEFRACPIRTALGCLGRKWALIVLRDVAFRGDVAFGELLANNRGLTPRVLSLRLRDLREEGLIRRVEDRADRRRVHYRLTVQGRDAVPVLTALIQYSIRYHAPTVFRDRRPRDLGAMFPDPREFLLGRLAPYARAPPARTDR